MRNLVTGVAFSVLFTVNAAAVTPSMLTFVQLVDFCTSKTLAEAEAKGDQLGWRRLTPAELENWRTSYIASTGNTVEGSGWRRGDKDGGDSLSFWVARGPGQHRACAYSVTNPAGLLDDLSERFGTPSNLEKHDFGTTASWKLGVTEISFSQVGQSAVLYIVHGD
jgi:hypothetical protein